MNFLKKTVFLLLIATSATVSVAQGNSSYPTSPPAAICGSASLKGPTEAPPASISVPAGNNANFNFAMAHTTYYFETGVHTLAPGMYAQIQPATGSTFIGAPGAILDGRNDNNYAFTQEAENVTIKYLTIRNFKAPRDEGVVNHNSGNGWVIEHNTLINNKGAALMAGANNRITGNCFKDNGQYGLNAYKEGNSITGLLVEGNEFVGNNTDDWESKIDGCGCTGGMKFWAATNVDVKNNWVHDNRGPGIWADTNNNDFLIEGNLIEANDGHGIFYEISYNAQIKNNNIKNNAWKAGRENSKSGDPFPIGAIYLSEANGEPRVPARTAKIEITGNLFDNNWGGIVGWENADRFCNSPASTTSDCTRIVGPLNTAKCASPAINNDPLYTDCRWWTRNVEVHHNIFNFVPAKVDGGCPTDYCGHSGLLSNWGTYPDWSPYKNDVIQKTIVFKSNNKWHDNTYTGPWQFKVIDMGNKISIQEWTHAPYSQDTSSTFNAAAF